MDDPIAEDIAHLEQLVDILRRRQQVLETQIAGYGILAAPAHLLLDQQDTAQQLQYALARLDRLRTEPDRALNPYLGLLTFQEADADRFFGRDALVADLVARVEKSSFLAVLGPSGSGKSSVVRAGLIPMLKGGALPGSERWRYILLRPGARPLDALAAELARLQGDSLNQVLELRTSIVDRKDALIPITDLLLDHQRDQRLVLLVDQFEELWTLAPAEERSQFIDLLIGAADTPLLVVLAMRADFLHRAAEHPALAKAIGEHDVIVSPMQVDELRAAIERPAEVAGGSFEPGLVDELAKQSFGRAGALPLLEYTLQEMWKLHDNGVMTWASYRALGGIEGALAARADAILQRYTPEQQGNLRLLLLRLVQPGEGVVDSRRRVRIDELVPAGASIEIVQLLINPLVDERLLTTGRDDISGVETVELAHEALLRAWPTFSNWIDEARADLRYQFQLEEAAQEWRASGENADLLWRGIRLAQVESFLERGAFSFNERVLRFVYASRAAEEASQQREALLLKEAKQQRGQPLLRIVSVAAGGLVLFNTAYLLILIPSRTQTGNTATLALFSLTILVGIMVGIVAITDFLQMIGMQDSFFQTLRSSVSIGNSSYRFQFNPYIVGDPIKDSANFFGRDAELTIISNSIARNHILIYGDRRIGKTSLLYQLLKRIPESLSGNLNKDMV